MSSPGRNRAVTVVAIVLVARMLSAQSAPPTTRNDLVRACDWAQSQMELNQCSGEQYRKADSRLNVVYGNVLHAMQKDLAEAQHRNDADDVKFSRLAIAKLKAAERAWVQYRDLHCDAARHEIGGGSMSPMVWANCMANTTADRIEELKQAYETGDRKIE